MGATADIPTTGDTAAEGLVPAGAGPGDAGAGGADVGDGVAQLWSLVDRIQLARRGSAALDRQVEDALRSDPDEPPSGRAISGKRSSCDLDHAIAMLPPSYNYSHGRRDGVCWAWIQPNDRWEPNEYEARHDHPGGSGLVVANTAALAVACASVILRIRRLEAPIEADPPMTETCPAE